MNQITPPYYTSAQLARPLNVSRRAIQLRLVNTPYDAIVSARGQDARAWSVASLPQALQSELEAAMQERGCRDVHHLLSDPPKPFALPVPWSVISEIHRQNAEKLCAAMAPVLERQHALKDPEFLEFALAQYKQHFGHEVSKDRLRYVISRATERDNGFQQWQSPALYLDDEAFRTAAGSPPTTPAPGIHVPLNDIISTIKDKSNPTWGDLRHLFPAAFKHLEAHPGISPSKGELRTFKHGLIAFLYHHVPGLHRPQAASAGDLNKPILTLRRRFNRLLQWWIELDRPSVLPADERAEKCGRKGYEHKECDKLITAHAAKLRGAHGTEGNVDLAIKMLFEKKALCSACWQHYGPGKLSSRNRERLTPNAIQVAATKDAEAIRKFAPTHHTEWDTLPGDRFVIDDMTTNELTWDEVDGETVHGQAQLLFTEDEHSGYPLPFLLYFGAPNGNTIKTAVGLVLKHVGLPHLALLTERGVFANRKLAGERNIQHQAPFRELQAELESYFKFEALPDEALAQIRSRDLGLRDPAYRLTITQARSPQAKTVERSFFEFQKSASRLSGFAGFNQRNEQSRTMQDFDRRVKNGKEHPGNEYLHLSDLRKNYEMIMAEIAARPVNGMRHRGRSPLEVWKEALSRHPLRKLPPEIEALLGTHRLPEIKVHSQGIKIKLDKFETAFYFDENTGPLVGRHVAVRINYALPDHIHLEHPDTGKLMKVDRNLTRRTTATPEEIATVNRARRAHINGALGEIGNVKNLFTTWEVRDSLHSPGDIEHGARIAADAEEHKQEQSRITRDKRKLSQKAAILGSSIASTPRNTARVDQGLDLEAEARAEIEALKDNTQEKTT